MTYQQRLDALKEKASKLGIDLNYEPEVKGVFPEQNDEWLKARKEGIGGSEAGAILGISKYQSAAEVAVSKLSDKLQNDVTPDQQYTLDFGHALEPLMLKLYEAKTGFKVWQGNSTQYRHPLYPFMYGDCDGYALTNEGEKIGIECKTFNYEMKNMWKSGVYGKGGVVKNAEYVAQVAHYMAVENLTRFDLLAICGNNANDLEVVTFYRDLDFEKNLIEAEKEFWDDIKEGKMPELKSLSKYSFDKMVEIIKPEEVEEEEVKLPLMFQDALEELDNLSTRKSELKKQIDALEERENALKLPIIESMKGAKTATLDLNGEVFKISYKPNIKEDVDKDKLSISYPEVWEEVKKQNETKPIWRMSRKAVKKK